MVQNGIVIGNDKLNVIAQRVIDNIGKQYMAQLMEKDGRLRSLMQQKKKAFDEKQFFKAQIIERQMISHTNELLAEEAGRRIHAMCENGEIDSYLDDEDYAKIENGNAQVHILLDALDSVFTDIIGVYDSCGFAPQELYIQSKLRDIRKVIGKWFSNCNVRGTQYEEYTRAEGDRLYELAIKRQQMLFNKINRIENKKHKTQ